MIYTITSTLPLVHAGRTKALLKRIKLYNNDLNIAQNILTTNYNPNYSTVYKSFIDNNILDKDTHIINIYDWLSDFKLLNEEPLDIIEQKIRISNYNAKPDLKKNCKRYYDNDSNRYILYRQYYPNSKVIKFEDYFTEGVKHKSERWEYNESGYLHKITNFSRKINKKIAEFFYDLEGNLYCKKFFEENENNKLVNIVTYKNNIINKSFNNENELFKYFFDSIFKKGDKVFNDARLLDKSLLQCEKDIKTILVFHNSHVTEGELKNSYKYALNNSDKVAKYYLLTEKQKIEIQNDFQIQDEKFAVIPHFIKPSNLVCEKKDQFIYLGRFSEEKQISHIIHAYKKFKETGYSTKLVLYGGTDDKSKNEIRNLIYDLDLEKDVEIHSFTDNPSKAFAESIASLLTSKYEGFALTVMESINEGCPSISYDLKYGPSEIIENGVNGYLIEPNNIEKFAEAMVSIKKYPLKEVQTKNSLRYECAIKNLENLLADI